MVWMILLSSGLIAAALIAVYWKEIHENNLRAQRGEPQKIHHDITDWPLPVEVIDRTPHR